MTTAPLMTNYTKCAAALILRSTTTNKEMTALSGLSLSFSRWGSPVEELMVQDVYMMPTWRLHWRFVLLRVPDCVLWRRFRERVLLAQDVVTTRT